MTEAAGVSAGEADLGESAQRTRVRLAPAGRDARRALADVVADVQAGDVLAPATVVVPSNTAGLSLRRRLPDLLGRGVLNVRFLVLARLSELLGSPALAASGRRPLTPAVRAACVEGVLRGDAGVFAPVADHPSTARTLEAAFRELRALPDDALDRLARRGARTADVVRLFRAFRAATSAFYDEHDLALAAAEAVGNDAPALDDVGTVVLYLPSRLLPADDRLVGALAQADRLWAIIGITGDAVADGPARAVASRLGVDDPALPSGNGTSATRLEVVTAPDAETELRLVARRIVQGLSADPPVPLHRTAVLTRQPAPYALLAHGVFEGAGIPHNGPAVRTLAHLTAGRVLLGLLALPDRQFRRPEVAAWLSSGPIRDVSDRDRMVPAGRWDLLSREAGIVRGVDQWDVRLGKLEWRLDRALEEWVGDDEETAARRERIEIRADEVRALRRFVAETVAALRSAPSGSWRDLAAWAADLLVRLLGTEGHLSTWSDEELNGYRRVEAILGDLGTLDDVHADPDLSTFRRALERELDAPAGRVGRFGEGVFVGRLVDAVGLDVDQVFVVGMIEGAFPPRPPLDALLSDVDRHATGGLRTVDDRRAEERAAFLAALAAAPHAVLSHPRVDPRSGREAHAAPWVVEQNVAPDVVPSFASLVERGEPGSLQERDLIELWAWHDGGLPDDHPLLAAEPALADGVAAVAARDSPVFTAWDGNVGPRPGLFRVEEPLSPTRIERWAACPRRYLLERVLGLGEVEEPEEFATLSAADRGSLVHDVLERLLLERVGPESPGERWSDAARRRAGELAAEVCDEYEAQGRTGTSLLWRLERRRIVHDVLRTLEEDDRLRRELWVSPVGVEVGFGLDDSEPVVVELRDGRPVPFRGRIDRVDRSPDGTRLVVLDYKTGRPAKAADVEVGMLRGTLLQLPLYARAAVDRFGPDATEVEAYYWYVSDRGAWDVVGYPVDPDRVEKYRGVLSTIVEGIEGGVFPARPGPEEWGGFRNCQWCPFDRLCPTDRDRAWDRMRDAPELGAYIALSEATADVPPEDDA